MYDFVTEDVEGTVQIGSRHGDFTCSLKWCAQLEIRSWGIKDVSVWVPDQIIQVSVTLQDFDKEEEDETLDLTLEIKDACVEGADQPSYMPRYINIVDGEVTVEFS